MFYQMDQQRQVNNYLKKGMKQLIKLLTNTFSNTNNKIENGVVSQLIIQSGQLALRSFDSVSCICNTMLINRRHSSNIDNTKYMLTICSIRFCVLYGF